MQCAQDVPHMEAEVDEVVEDDDGQEAGPSTRREEDIPSAQRVKFHDKKSKKDKKKKEDIEIKRSRRKCWM